MSTKTVNVTTTVPVVDGIPLIPALSVDPIVPSSPSSNSALKVDAKVPPFTSVNDEMYDQNTYYGRFRKMLNLVDPRTLLYTESDLKEAQFALSNTIDNHDNDAKLWEYKKICDAMIHPDTKEIIPKPFRMSGYIPYNAPICVGALMATSPMSILFWQWSNQTHNALINYNNSNKTQPLNITTSIQGYIGAVTGACIVSLGLKSLIDRSTRLSIARKMKYQRFVALPAIISAAAINIILMRQNELTTGINIYYEQEQEIDSMETEIHTSTGGGDSKTTNTKNVVVGTSQVAARKALQEMVISRMILPLPVFLLPPIGLACVEALATKSPMVSKFMARHQKYASLGLNTFFVLVGFGVGLPATIALFPQNGTIHANQLEDRFQHLQQKQKDNNGTVSSASSLYPITTFKYNKGL